ncbi:uncharacterized protein LOC116106632 [Pistacia vera]|uniref:uncharacterized protein LOC116106632 n=1 Tax=Pistacia vera TaxID=55513 RepID=UPI0012630C13|nr:uncharacterized protein LOC116106632 [Pistacia vera]
MIGSWNIRGLDGFSKQRAVRNWIFDASLGLIGFLETKEITFRVTHVSKRFSFGITFVHGSNDPGNCRNLVGGDHAWYGYMDDFGQCIHDAELIGIPFTGLRDIVQAIWDEPIVGNPMFRLTQKLGLVKRKLKALHIKVSSYISSKVIEARAKWATAQGNLDRDPFSTKYISEERNLANQYFSLCRDEETFFKQRSLVQWLHLGDQNTKFFHKMLIHRQDLLVAPSQPQIAEASRYFSGRISPDMISPLTAPITDDQIRIALFSIPDDKASGSNGFISLFFKRAWDIIGKDFRDAVRHFFATNEMPRCVNATRIALVPKVESPSRMTDFRPISCCNVLCKCISKVIVNRFKVVLPDIIGVSQSAFVSGRRISDYILLTQKLLRNYHLGELHSFFKSSRGVRQGDLLSPYLFVLAMEGLAGIFRETSHSPGFHYHWRCRQTAITHLCFADDLMVFCRVDGSSVSLIKSALDYFAKVSGLVTNAEKSQLFLSGVTDEEQIGLKSIMGFQLGQLPVRYLGVPLICTRLRHSDCRPLLERILSRIRLWTLASLTYAGQLQLIKPGTSLSPSGAKVAWSSVCYPLTKGGLGIKRIQDWNRAAILKHVWRLLTDRSFIWSSWARLVLLYGRSFWHIRVTSRASWAWRKILLSRVWCRGLIVTCIRDGRDIMLWRDHWLPQGPLCDLLPFRTLTSTGLPWDARVSDIIRDGLWDFPLGNTDLQHIWDSITMQPSASHPDHLVWKGHPSGRFSIDLAWNVLRDKRDANSIHHLLLFLGSATETHDHLFFSCDFSSYVWREHCSSCRDIVLAICDLVRAKILGLAPKYEISTQLRVIWHLPD